MIISPSLTPIALFYFTGAAILCTQGVPRVPRGHRSARLSKCGKYVKRKKLQIMCYGATRYTLSAVKRYGDVATFLSQ